jgi:hypothetical protein
MEIHKPREKEKGISERGNNIAKMGSVLHETSGRAKGKRKGRNRNEEEEVRRQIRKLKKIKARGGDGVQNVAWSMVPKRDWLK